MASESETEKSNPLSSNPVLLCSNVEEANGGLNLKLVEEAGIATQIDALNSSPPDLMEAIEVLQEENIVKLSEEIEEKDWNEAEEDDDSVVVEKEVKKAVGCQPLESDKLVDWKIDTSDNIVLKKLLRGPRYFDLPDSGWGACYNCGEEGHTAVSCTSAKRKKPCFTCGSLEHNAKQCGKGKVCFICQKGGHHAKDCSEKKSGGAYLITKICLKCGQSGHEMFSCKSDYSSDDIKEIQCYVCKNYGHLCCAKYTCAAGGNVSCYRCGQSGHTGLACKGLHGEADDVGSSSTCYRCGKGGHFARECSTPAKTHTRFRGETDEMESPDSCYRCGENGHFARECTNSAMGTRSSGGRNEMMATPSSCYKCGEGGHFARECTGSPMAYKRFGGEPFEMDSFSSCYRCGGGGHFARECTSSAKSSLRLPGDPHGTWSTGSCYKCGEGGHFARECTTSAKNLKRNRESSTPKFKHSKQKESSDRKSWPRDLGKAHKRKRTQYEREFSTPLKSKSRGGWITDDPGDWPQQNSRKKCRKSPATPASKNKKVQNLNVGGYSSNSRSPRNFRKFQLKNSTDSKFHNDFSTRRRFPQF